MLTCILLLSITPGQAQDMRGFSSRNFSSGDLEINNNAIDDGWADIDQLDLSTFGSGGYAKFANNGTHMFTLLRATSSLNWISIEFDYESTGCMKHDGWVFYLSNGEVDAKDVYFEGTVSPTVDSQNDLLVESVVDNNMVDIEIIRTFNTADTTDIEFLNDTVTFIAFASDTDHFEERETFYLSIKYYDLADGAVLPVDEELNFDIPQSTDWTPVKKNVLYGALLFVGVFIHIHHTIRVAFRPLEHGSRIVDSNFKAPKLLDQIDDIRSKGDYK